MKVRLYFGYLEVPHIFIVKEDSEQWRLQDEFNHVIEEFDVPSELIEKWESIEKSFNAMRNEMAEFYNSHTKGKNV